jgi:hypothetical protein
MLKKKDDYLKIDELRREILAKHVKRKLSDADFERL